MQTEQLNTQKIELMQGDCLEKMRELPDGSVDAIVTDPPYELGFMGKKWDASGIAYSVDLWAEALRVLKPGGHLLAFGGTRTYHRMAVAIEDTGFEVRDMLKWIYASGFPKSQNVGKAYDKKMGNEREEVEYIAPDGKKRWGGRLDGENYKSGDYGVYQGASHTKGNSEWEGFGTALKPAHEPIVLARKPLSEKTIVENCIKHGTGALDIDGCRIPTSEEITNHSRSSESAISKGKYGDSKAQETHQTKGQEQGRFPANLLVTDDALSKEKSRYFDIDVWGEKHGLINVPKASKKERNAGCEGLEEKSNHHPTVKPLHLMSWLIRLVSKEGDTALDPFMGSGTTGVACKSLNRNFIGIELDPEYFKIAEKRITAVWNGR